MKTSSQQLLEELTEMTRKNISAVMAFKKLSADELNRKSHPKSWSILECIEHLNRFGDFYIPEIKRAINQSKYDASEYFKSGFIGNRFAESMLPNSQMKKMKSPKAMNPINSNLNRQVLDKFLHQQDQLLKILKKAETVSLTKTKVSTSLSRFLKLRLGDVLRAVIYHNLRHIKQAEKIIL